MDEFPEFPSFSYIPHLHQPIGLLNRIRSALFIMWTSVKIFPPRVQLSGVYTFHYDNQKIDAKIALPNGCARARRIVVDTGAGPNLVRQYALPPDYVNFLKPLKTPCRYATPMANLFNSKVAYICTFRSVGIG